MTRNLISRKAARIATANNRFILEYANEMSKPQMIKIIAKKAANATPDILIKILELLG